MFNAKDNSQTAIRQTLGPVKHHWDGICSQTQGRGGRVRGRGGGPALISKVLSGLPQASSCPATVRATPGLCLGLFLCGSLPEQETERRGKNPELNSEVWPDQEL